MVKFRNDFQGEDEKGVRYTTKISYNASKENKRTMNQFLQIAEEFDGVRINAIRHLLDAYEWSWKWDDLHMRMAILEDRIAAMELYLAEKGVAKEQQPQQSGKRTFADPRGE